MLSKMEIGFRQRSSLQCPSLLPGGPVRSASITDNSAFYLRIGSKEGIASLRRLYIRIPVTNPLSQCHILYALFNGDMGLPAAEVV
jgi:hypothetical protein